jgi:hypothetical protein
MYILALGRTIHGLRMERERPSKNILCSKKAAVKVIESDVISLRPFGTLSQFLLAQESILLAQESLQFSEGTLNVNRNLLTV